MILSLSLSLPGGKAREASSPKRGLRDESSPPAQLGALTLSLSPCLCRAILKGLARMQAVLWNSVVSSVSAKLWGELNMSRGSEAAEAAAARRCHSS